MAALRRPRGVNATIECDADGELFEVYYTFNVKGSIANGIYVPVEPVGEGNGCPATGIQYLPKNLTTTPKVSPTTCPYPGPTSTST
jgi:ribonuclease T2